MIDVRACRTADGQTWVWRSWEHPCLSLLRLPFLGNAVLSSAHVQRCVLLSLGTGERFWRGRVELIRALKMGIGRRTPSAFLPTIIAPVSLMASAARASVFGLACRHLRGPVSLTPARSFASSRAMSSPYKVISTSEAPSAVGPYSQCIIHNNVAYVSGCIPFVPETMTLIEGGIEAQTEQAITNLFAVVKAAGSEPSVSRRKCRMLAFRECLSPVCSTSSRRQCS